MSGPPTEEAFRRLPIVELLPAIGGEVGALPKTERNQAQGFSFRGVDSVMNHVGPVFHRHGVTAAITGFDILDRYEKATARGGTMRGLVVDVTVTFVGPVGDRLDVHALAEAADSGDRAAVKAEAIGFRNAILHTLCLPTHEPDPDADAPSEPPDRPAKAKKQPARPATPRAADTAAPTKWPGHLGNAATGEPLLCPACGEASIYPGKADWIAFECRNTACQGGQPKQRGDGRWPWSTKIRGFFDTGVAERMAEDRELDRLAEAQIAAFQNSDEPPMPEEAP